MMCYKAVERYYNYAGNLKEHLCGYGRVESLDEARSKWAKNVKVVKISDAELKELEEAQRKREEEDRKKRAAMDWSY